MAIWSPTCRPIRNASVNPSTLIFSYTPVEDPAVYQKVWDGFIKHLEKTTGKHVVFFPVQSNAAQYEAMRSGRLHVAGVNAGGNALAVNCAGFVPFAMMASKDGSFGYEMEIIVPADSPIKTPADLKGHKVAFTDATSNSGFKAPSAILKADFNLEAKRDYEPVFSGKHDNSILGVVNKDYEAAAVANSVLNRMIDRKVFDPAKIRSIYKSETFPTTGYGYAYNLDPTLVEKIKEAFFSFPVGGLGAAGRVQEGGQVHPDRLQEGLGGAAQDRRGQPASNTLASNASAGRTRECLRSRG